MALTPQQLATASPCFDCIPRGMRDAVIIYLLNQLASMATPQQLVDASRCYDCIPVGLRGAVMIYLQDAILAGGGGGGATEVFSLEGTDNPTTEGIVPTGAGVAYNETPSVWVYNTFTGQWDQIIA